jgi:hypothetical protein
MSFRVGGIMYPQEGLSRQRCRQEAYEEGYLVALRRSWTHAARLGTESCDSRETVTLTCQGDKMTR